MESTFLAHLECLSMAQKTILAKVKIQTVSELLLASPSELAKKCRIPLKDMETLMDAVSKELAPKPHPLREVAHLGEEKFTTGDSHLDDVLGGGIRTGMLWEISGENNAGKTQLALQLSLTVQLPQRLGGLFGAACYITTREALPTTRAQEMIIKHPLLTPDLCGLPDIFTVKAPFFVALTKVLTESVPAFADQRASTPGSKPAKLLVIDTFTDIFDHVKDERYEDTTLRARDLRSVSLILHRLASKYRLAVVILGGTRVTFPRMDGGDRAPGELRYSDQARWFARAHTVHGEDAHEAILGHVWPNQLNARIMMSRTIRTRPRSVVDPRVQERETKRRKVEGGQQHLPTPTSAETVPFRRFSVIFSSAGPPASCDYVILDEGVLGIPAEEQPPSTFLYPTPPSASSLPSAPATQSSGFTPRSTAPPSDTAQTQTPRYMQSLSYASGPVSRAPSVPPSQPFATQSSTNTTTTTDTQASISTTASSYANQPTHPPSTAPPSQSVVPSSQPDLDEDWDMYWKDIEGDDQLYVSAEGQTGDVELEEAAEAGPPAEGHDTDSDYYWKDGNENDALYTDL